MDKNKWPGRIVLIAIFLFFYFPIIYMIVFSFNDSRSLSSFGSFSLQWYERMFSDRNMLEAIYYTLITAIIATAVSTVVGTITAIGLSGSKKIVREVVQQVNDLPMMNPEIVTAVGLMLFYVSLRVEKGFITMLLAHIAFCIPYVILSIMPKLRSLDPNLAEAAMDLGATPFQAMTKVIIPQIMPGVVSGALIAFTMSFDDFIISYFVTGNGVKNISTLVWTMSKRINPSINALSTLIIVMITIVLILVNIIPIIREKTENHENKVLRHSVKMIALTIALIIGGTLGWLKGSTKQVSSADAIAKYGTDTLKVYNVGEYIDPAVNDLFEQEFGVKVIYDTFDSNELMYTKLQGGESYDVIVPSDYMIERLLHENMLQPIKKDYITNYDQLSQTVLDLGHTYDPTGEYTIPYMWGSVGIVYNQNEVDISDLETEGFEILRDKKYKGRIYIYDSERDSFMMALKALGYSMNTNDEQELKEAYEWLVELNLTMNPEIVTDEVIDAMINGNKDMAVVYSGDAAYILSENEDMLYYTPNEGTNLWSDCMCIPATSKYPELASEYMNFVIDYENALMISQYVGYTSSNEEVIEYLSSEQGDFYGNIAYLPRTGYELDEVFRYNSQTKKIMSDYWVKVKISN